MTRFLLMTASAMALGMASPSIAQAFGPNDAFIEQIGDNNSAAVNQTGSSSGKRSDIEQISGNAAEVRQGGGGNLHKSTIPQAAENAAYVPLKGPESSSVRWEKASVTAPNVPLAP